MHTIYMFYTIQFSSVAQSGLTLCYSIDCSTPGLHVHHQLLEFTQTHVHGVGDAIQPSHPLLSPSPAFNLSQHQGLFQWVSSLHQVTIVLEFQLQHQFFQWIFRISSKWIWNHWSFSQISCCLFPLGAARVGSANCFSSKRQWSSFSPLANGSHIAPGVPPGLYVMSDHSRCTVLTLPTLRSLCRQPQFLTYSTAPTSSRVPGM